MNQRPDFKKLNPAEIEYIELLEKLRDSIDGNGAVSLGIAINSKLKDISEEMTSEEIKFISTDDKKYDRFLNTCKIFKDLAETMKWFKENYGEKIKEAEAKNTNLLEKAIRGAHTNRGKG